MNLKQLEAYLWVAKLGSFSKTAERLFTTQPAISSRISNLEDELGTPLFTRETGAVRLTAAGRALMPLVEDALSAVEAMRARAGLPVDVEEAAVAYLSILADQMLQPHAAHISAKLNGSRNSTLCNEQMHPTASFLDLARSLGDGLEIVLHGQRFGSHGNILYEGLTFGKCEIRIDE